MRITANQLTLVRILLIPIPVVLILMGGRDLKLVAWALYILVGVTDFFDGMLARKYGTTKLGALLDPIADKIYISLLFIPLGLLSYIPLWMVVAILIRDPIVTALRSLSQMKGIVMKTASLAQYKTAIQMITGGYILWVCLIPDRSSCLTGMVVAAGLCLLWFAVYFYLRRKWHPRLLTLVGLVGAAPVVRYLCSVQATAWIFGLAVLGITWASAAWYLKLFVMRFSSGKGRVSLQWWIVNVLESLALPLLVLAMLGMENVPAWVPMGVLGLEFAVGALDNIMTSEGKERPLLGTWLKLLLQAIPAGVIFWKAFHPASVPALLGHLPLMDAYLFLAATFVAFLFLFARHGVPIIVGKA